jgi:hypothetical protein
VAIGFDKMSRSMADFEVYIDDDRYQVPSLYLITANSEARARAIVDDLWRSSEHHHGVELRRNGERLLGLGSLAEGMPPGHPPRAPQPSGPQA